MAAPAATTEVASVAGDATTGVAVPEKPRTETLVEFDAGAERTGGFMSSDLGGIDEGAAAGA